MKKSLKIMAWLAGSIVVLAVLAVVGLKLFLPAEKRSFWYRSDPGSGRPPYVLLALEQRLDELVEPFGIARARDPKWIGFH